MRIAIIGAGPAGLTIAHQLTKHHMEVDVYDSAADVGGFAKSVELLGNTVEIGPHFLNVGQLPSVKHLVLETLNGNYKTYNRKTFILTINKLFTYPPSPGDILKKLNTLQLATAFLSVLRQKLSFQKTNGSAGVFVKNQLGKYLYKYFFEAFSLKLWGMSADYISDNFAKSLIGFNKGLSPLKIIANQLFKSHRTKDVYIYPNGGLSTLWNALKLTVEEQGGRFLLSSQIVSLSSNETCPDHLTHVRLADGTVTAYDYFISTIPVGHLINYLKKETNSNGIALPSVRFRSDVLIYLKVEYASVQDGQCFYVYTEDIAITRITNFNKFDDSKDDSFAIILLEFWCGKNDIIWNTEKPELLKLAQTQLEKTKIFTGLKILDFTIKKVESAFQIPDMDYLNDREQVFKQLSVFQNLMVTGRNASVNFNYGMENAIDDGIKMAQELIASQQHQPKPETV